MTCSFTLSFVSLQLTATGARGPNGASATSRVAEDGRSATARATCLCTAAHCVPEVTKTAKNAGCTLARVRCVNHLPGR